MKEKRIVFIAKTDINTDGRIINQINILMDRFKSIFIDFIILPDKKIKIDLGNKVKFHTVNCTFRNSSLMRVFTILQFTFKALALLRKVRPDIIHVQDSAGSLPVLFYKMFNRNVLLVYDDHEIPNRNATFFEKMNIFIENKLIKRADYLIEANEERLEYVVDKLSLKNLPATYFLNLPYELNNVEDIKIDQPIKDILIDLDSFIANGGELIIHQGPLKVERGRSFLANFVPSLNQNQKILLVGGQRQDFELFVKENQLCNEKFIFVGTVNYQYLPLLWMRAKYSIIMYLPTYLNNKLCAPNRYYLSLKYNITTIVNESNPVLRTLINKFRNGFFIEEILSRKSFEKVVSESKKGRDDSYVELEKSQIKQFCDFYSVILKG